MLLGNSRLTQICSCAHLSYLVHVRVLPVCAHKLLSALSHKHCMIRTVTDRMNTSYYLTLWPVASSPKNLPYLMYLFGCIQTMCPNITTFCWAKKYPIFSSSLYFPITSVTHNEYNLEQLTEKVLPCFEITWYSQLSPAKVKSNSSF